VILLVWLTLNISAWVRHWDPYPFILLNLVLAFQAAYAAPILMISQNRQAKLSERRNHLDLQINMLAEQETTEMLRLLRLLCEHNGVRLEKHENGRAFEEETKAAEILRQIQAHIEEGAAETHEQAAENRPEPPGGTRKESACPPGLNGGNSLSSGAGSRRPSSGFRKIGADIAEIS
jgi:uncharacterized membrane protein